MLLRYTNMLLKHLDHYRRFPGESYGGFRGIYESFDQAIAAAPKTKPIGYDDEALADSYARDLDETIRQYDYPVLFWMQKLLTDGTNVFDFGGNVGTHYFQYRGYLQLTDTVTWTVLDLPEIVKAGKHRHSEQNLFFTDDVNQVRQADILLASGVVQYIEDFSTFVSTLNFQPPHLLINRLPLYDGERFVTLQNGGNVFYPQYVFNRARFIRSIEDIGYRLVDEWIDYIDSCFIPFRSRNSLPHYCGLYFEMTPRNLATGAEA